MIAQIDAEIAALEMRIAKLRDARDTIESLEGPVSQGGYHPFPSTFEETKISPGPRHNEIQTKVESRPPPQSSRRSSAGRAFVAGLIDKPASAKDQILTLIRETETPLTSGEIRDQIGSGVRKQTVWAALSDMTKNGVLKRSDDGKYTLASND
ncbi:hypothetical protein Cp1R7AA1_110 [Mesorhizobium phage Cp1R7A-A1]|nr:hypothetical protein Cp1R7AA1_110 [Mesorhizobium phage Cp1R7A-A1]